MKRLDTTYPKRLGVGIEPLSCIFKEKEEKVVIEMKKNSPLWGSISILIGVVIAVLALTGGILRSVLLIAVFTVWSLWVILALVLPARRTVKTMRRTARAADPNTALMRTLLHHVNYRISGCLKLAYPEATWEWVMRDPAAFVAQGGTGRIRVFGIPDYDHADVTLDRNGKLACSLVRLAPINETKGKPAAPGQESLDPRIWYEAQGSDILESLVTDLASRGHHSLTLKEDGSICIKPADGGEELCQGSFPSFPNKVYWPGLVKVLEQNGLAATAIDTGIVVAW